MCIKRVKMMIRTLKELLKRILPEAFEGAEVETTKPEGPKKEKLEYRVISTSQGGPNMPKFQPCLVCRGGAKRQGKTIGGAYYYCSKHARKFFVRSVSVPGLIQVPAPKHH